MSNASVPECYQRNGLATADSGAIRTIVDVVNISSTTPGDGLSRHFALLDIAVTKSRYGAFIDFLVDHSVRRVTGRQLPDDGPPFLSAYRNPCDRLLQPDDSLCEPFFAPGQASSNVLQQLQKWPDAPLAGYRAEFLGRNGFVRGAEACYRLYGMSRPSPTLLPTFFPWRGQDDH